MDKLKVNQNETEKSFKTWLNNDYYSLLGVTKFSDNKEIQKAFKQKAKELNPDHFPLSSLERKNAESFLKQLIVAKETLTDRNKRDKYDSERQILQDCYLSFIKTENNNINNLDELYKNSNEVNEFIKISVLDKQVNKKKTVKVNTKPQRTIGKKLEILENFLNNENATLTKNYTKQDYDKVSDIFLLYITEKEFKH